MKKIIPKFGKFTNGYYDIVGIIWFGRLIGKCVRSEFECVIKVNEIVDLPEYHLPNDIKPQFRKK
jgi:hypothetical protein